MVCCNTYPIKEGNFDDTVTQTPQPTLILPMQQFVISVAIQLLINKNLKDI